jgi:hypothetical protein
VTTADEHLNLLGFALGRPLLGTVTTYRIPEAAEAAWGELLRRYRAATASRGNLPYGSLAAGLSAAACTSVNLFPSAQQRSPRLMVVRRRLSAEDLHDALAVFEQAILGIPADQAAFSYPSQLADVMAAIEPEETALASHLKWTGNQPDPPGWLYDAACWEAASRLAEAPWPLEDREIRLRMDTEGNLVVWDNELLWRGGTGEHVRFAAARVKLAMKTMPGIRTPLLVVDPSVSWLANRLSGARTAWLAQEDLKAPLLVLRLRGRPGRADVDPATRRVLLIWGKLRGYPRPLPDQPDLTGEPGRLRALIPVSVSSFPIGRGLGMHTMRELHSHVARTLGAEPLIPTRVRGHRFPARRGRPHGRDEALLDPQSLPDTIAAAGCRRLRIVVLYATQHSRARMQRLLAYQFARPDLAEHGIPEDTEISLLDDVVSLVVHQAAELLAHGPHGPRAGLIQDIPWLRAREGTRVLALCKTVYDSKRRQQMQREARKNPELEDPEHTDAKRVVRQLLARQGVLAQFFVEHPPGTRFLGDASSGTDHRANSALADLLRAGGLVDGRMGEALAFGPLGIKAPYAYVGLHIRQQKTQWPPRSVVTLAALVPRGERWSALGYCSRPHPLGGATGWLPLGRGVEAALAQLRPHLWGLPYVLFVPGEPSRSLWPGLANKNLERIPDLSGRIDDRLALPGSSLAVAQRPTGVVRITVGPEVPRPVEALQPATGKTKRTTGALYVVATPGPGGVWILSNIPRQFAGGKVHSRAGNDHSRWQAQPEEMSRTWHAHTATEIFVLEGTEDPLRFAVAAARLCDHPIAWDGRTRFPAPLHLAAQMDRDHPEYRQSVDMGEDLEDVDNEVG